MIMKISIQQFRLTLVEFLEKLLFFIRSWSFFHSFFQLEFCPILRTSAFGDLVSTWKTPSQSLNSNLVAAHFLIPGSYFKIIPLNVVM